jgi:hypothetical protein
MREGQVHGRENVVLANTQKLWILGLLLSTLVVSGCGGGGAEGSVLIVDAEYDPMAAATTFDPIASATPGVAQTFTVLAAGKFERFWIVLSQINAVDSGTIRITVRPLIGGLPDPSAASSIISPIDVVTTTLPVDGVESFAIFDVGADPGRQVLAGEQYAIVVEFLLQATGTGPIAKILGTLGGPYAGGTAAQDVGAGYVVDPTADDYIFRTFVLQ